MASQVAVASAGARTTPRGRQPAVLPELRSSDQAVDRTKPLPTSLQSDFLPDDILLSLVQPSPPYEKLGPPSRYRNLNTSVVPAKKPADNVWNNAKRREKFKYLTENVPCVCGAGKDISFLYDVPKPEESTPNLDPNDPSALRIQPQEEEEEDDEDKSKSMVLPETLIPAEYHVVKNKGVMGLEYFDDKFSSQPNDHASHLVMFPSLKPVSRYEVQQLKKTMEKMLQEVSMKEGEAPAGPTQMHNLLELIRREQDIYNLIFHELIRQVTVECGDRGELLSQLREKYSGLLNRVPTQIKGLHEEVLAQRALDRRLTEELLGFKSTICRLTDELTEVKEHDREVTLQAGQAQDDLKAALTESQKNASLLAEYHDLYELQRKRLETQVGMLGQEKEIWSAAAYSLALKVTEESNLNTAKRLHVSEKAWAKLANHFTILLSDKDTETLTSLQGFVDRFRDLLDEFNRSLRTQEETMREHMLKVKSSIQAWVNYFRKYILSKDGHLLKALDRDRTIGLYGDIKSWEETIAKQSEEFAGDMFLAGEDSLRQIRKQMDGWTDSALKVFNRHRAEDGSNHPDHDSMLKMNECACSSSSDSCTNSECTHTKSASQSSCTTESAGSRVDSNQSVVAVASLESCDSCLSSPSSSVGTSPAESSRHSVIAQRSDRSVQEMFEIQEEVEMLLKQYNIRLTGENGVATGLIHLSNSLETWVTRLNTVVHGSNPLPDQEWLRFYQLLDDWIQVVDETINFIGSPLKEGERDEVMADDEAKKPIEVADMMKKTQTWLSSSTNGIDSEDSKLVENVTSLHTEMVKWMVQVLLRLAPDRDDHSEEAKQSILMGSAPIVQIQANATALFQRLTVFSKYVTRFCTALIEEWRQQIYLQQTVQQRPSGKDGVGGEAAGFMQPQSSRPQSCCSGVVNDDMQTRLQQQQDDAEQEYRDLQKLMCECTDWVQTAQVLLCELTGEELPPGVVLPATAADQTPASTADTLNIGSREDTQASFVSLASTEPGSGYGSVRGDGGGRGCDLTASTSTIPEHKTLKTAGTQRKVPPPPTTSEASTTTFDLEVEIYMTQLNSLYTQLRISTEPQGDKQSPLPLGEGEKEVTAPITSPSPAPAPQAATDPEPPKTAEKKVRIEEPSVDIASPPPAVPSEPQLQVIGADANTHSTHLQERADQAAAQGDQASASLGLQQPPLTPNTKKAYEALAAVGELQQQLISTEERAQAAEEKVSALDNDLKEAMEKIRALERQAAKTPETIASSEKLKSATTITSQTPAPGPSKAASARADGKEEEKKSHSRASSRSSHKSKKSAK